jgi:NTE family protein
MRGTTGAATTRSSHTSSRGRLNRPPFECIALLLQGGGALGSYQAGVYEALAEADCHKVDNIVHLIYRARNYEGHSKD